MRKYGGRFSKFSDKQVHSEHYTVTFGNKENNNYFRTGVLNFDYFWKVFSVIFGNFRESFWKFKTPVYFWKIFDRRNSRNVDFCERRNSENFRPTQCLTRKVVTNYLNGLLKSIYSISLEILWHTKGIRCKMRPTRQPFLAY